MPLTEQQLQILRESTTDEQAFARVMAVFEEASTPTMNSLFNLSGEQLKGLQTVIDALPIKLYIKDTQSRFLMANRNTLDVLNVNDYRVIIGKTDFDFLEHDIAQQNYDMEQTLLRTQTPILNFENCVTDTEGNQRCHQISKAPIYDADGNLVGLIGINQDVTQRRIADDKLREERNLLRTVIDNIEDKIYVKDRQSRFVTGNKALLSLQGVNKRGVKLDTLVGTTDFDFMPTERAQVMFDEEQEIMNSGKASVNQELFTPDYVSNRGDLWFLVSKVPVVDEHGDVIGLVGVNRNITSRKLAQQRKIEVEVEREKSQFLQEFVKDSSHEFRTPLSVIRTAVYLLDKVQDTSKYPKYIEQIQSQTERIESLIADLNLMIKLDSSTFVETMHMRLSHTLAMLKDYAKYHQPENANLTIVIQDYLSSIEYNGNESMLEQALQRIIDNAIRYSHEGGTITIRAESTADAIQITIADEGIGMTDETMSAMYQRFFRADPSRTISGFGLGLPIAQRIIELHGGTIEATSTLDVGSTFTITLPFTEQAPSPEAQF